MLNLTSPVPRCTPRLYSVYRDSAAHISILEVMYSSHCLLILFSDRIRAAVSRRLGTWFSFFSISRLVSFCIGFHYIAGVKILQEPKASNPSG